MPHLFHQNACCKPGQWDGSPQPCRCTHKDRRTQWMLTKHERMMRHQFYYGLKPMAPGGRQALALFDEVTRRCGTCDGEGLVPVRHTARAAPYTICSRCRGFGRLPLPDDPAVVAVRARVAREFPDAAAPHADVDPIAYLREVLGGTVPLVCDVRNGMIMGPPGSDRP